MTTAIIRNGAALCAACGAKGCLRYWGHDDDSPPNVVEEYVSDEPCECCELDFRADDGFGI